MLNDGPVWMVKLDGEWHPTRGASSHLSGDLFALCGRSVRGEKAGELRSEVRGCCGECLAILAEQDLVRVRLRQRLEAAAEVERAGGVGRI